MTARRGPCKSSISLQCANPDCAAPCAAWRPTPPRRGSQHHAGAARPHSMAEDDSQSQDHASLTVSSWPDSESHHYERTRWLLFAEFESVMAMRLRLGVGGANRVGTRSS